jgi:hypothetical protein
MGETPEIPSPPRPISTSTLKKAIVELMEKQDRGFTANELQQILGLPAHGEGPGYWTLHNALRVLVKGRILLKSPFCKAHGRRIYGLSWEQIDRGNLQAHLSYEWEPIIQYLHHAGHPVLSLQLRDMFKFKGSWRRELKELLLMGNVKRGYVKSEHGERKRYEYLYAPTGVRITKEDKEELQSEMARWQRKKVLEGNRMERVFLDLLKAGPLPLERKSEPTLRRRFNDFTKQVELDIVEPIEYQGFGFPVFNVYEIKKRTISKVDVQDFADRLEHLRGTMHVHGRFLVCLEATKSAWEKAREKNILLVPAHRLYNLYPESEEVAVIKQMALENRRLQRRRGYSR